MRTDRPTAAEIADAIDRALELINADAPKIADPDPNTADFRLWRVRASARWLHQVAAHMVARHGV